MFETELAYFIQHQDELVEKFGGQVLVLRGTEIAGIYKTAIDAYREASLRFETGSFMIQPCAPGPSAYTVTLTSSEVFG